VQDILKEVHGKGQGTGPEGRSRPGAVHARPDHRDAGRRRRARAQERFGKGKVMTGEQVRWGLENLNLTRRSSTRWASPA
jgi:branched-chain amino acid transport system substrate-binding protein